jgi:hypothetical protein
VKYLCIGGPLDGQERDVTSAEDYRFVSLSDQSQVVAFFHESLSDRQGLEQLLTVYRDARTRVHIAAEPGRALCGAQIGEGRAHFKAMPRERWPEGEPCGSCFKAAAGS